MCRAPIEPRFTLAEHTELIRNDRCLLLVADHSGEIVGYIARSIDGWTEPAGAIESTPAHVRAAL
jgi:hypothetical protein